VLIDTMPLHAAAWQFAAAQRCLRVSRQDIYRWEGEPGCRTARRLLRRRARRGQGSPTSAGNIDALLRQKEARFVHLSRDLRVAPAWRALLTRLRKRRVPLALVTGTSRAEVQRVVPASIRRVFRVIITSSDVSQGKPHPQPYRRALRRLRVPPGQAIVIENARYGIRAARAARVGCVIGLTSSLPARELRGAHAVVHTAEELGAMLDCLTGARVR